MATAGEGTRRRAQHAASAADAEDGNGDLRDSPGASPADPRAPSGTRRESDAGRPGVADPSGGSIRIDVRVSARADREELEDLAAGLRRTPREIPAKYFYDELGSQLFERITELPEYYPFRLERSLLAECSDEIVAATRPDVLVEIGSGASTKTRFLLDAMRRAGLLRRYVPVDISSEILERVAAELVAEYPGLEVRGLIEDFVREPGGFPDGGRRLIAFLGGTIGNFREEEAVAFLRGVAAEMGPDDRLLLGTDLIKDVRVLEAAYNDSAGVTAEFNRNMLRVVNARAGGDFDPERFRHRAFYDVERHRIEMRLVSLADQTVRLERLPLELELREGEELRTEFSTKYDRALVADLLSRAGLELEAWMPDPEGLFALSLARRVGAAPGA